MLFLNVKAVFPSVIVERLIHNMRSHSILKEYTDWYENRFAQCTTTLSFDDFIYNPFNIPIGLDQGCPISPTAFLFYNAPLIELADNRKDLLRLGFINDTAFVARGQSFEDTNEKLHHLMEKTDGALTWSQSHHTEFELDKTALICATRLHQPDSQNAGKTIPTQHPPITIQGSMINPTPTCKFLGIIMDQELRFSAHTAYTIGKGTKYVLACKWLTRPSKGACMQMMKKLYEGVAVPKMMYVADIWATTHLKPGRGKRLSGWGARGLS